MDRAALDAALELGIACGGWCPKGRKAEDGPIDRRYPLQETPSGEYAQRTEWNVRDADGTLVLSRGRPTGGTVQTIEVAARLGKPCLTIDLAEAPDVSAVQGWIAEQALCILNVAGPRESRYPGIYAQVLQFLNQILTATRQTGST